MENKVVKKRILNDPVTYPEKFSESARSICEGLLCKEEDNRFGFKDGSCDELRAHPFFQDINWRKLNAGQFVTETNVQTQAISVTKMTFLLYILKKFLNISPAHLSAKGTLKTAGGEKNKKKQAREVKVHKIIPLWTCRWLTFFLKEFYQFHISNWGDWNIFSAGAKHSWARCHLMVLWVEVHFVVHWIPFPCYTNTVKFYLK